MTTCDLSPGIRALTVRLALAAGLFAGGAGCGGKDPKSVASSVIEPIAGAGLDGPALRVATCWSRVEREGIGREFRSQTALAGAIRLIWIELPVGMPLARMSIHLPPVDVFLGGPLTEYERLARAGKLASLKDDAATFWRVARRSVIEPNEAPVGWVDRPALDDPRVSPLTLTWAAGLLRNGSWQDGYASLVRLFGHAAARPGWITGSALAANERGLGWTPVAAWSPGTRKDPPLDSRAMIYEEGAAIVRGTRHEAAAQAFLRFLASRPLLMGGPSVRPVDPDAADLLADLLGATLIDAQDELLAAWDMIDRTGPSVSLQALRWLSEPPPWPPASVEKLQNRGGDRAIALVHDLAGQIAPDPALRFWLVQSWLRPRRLFDQSVLSELSRAEGGRLVREPRFRAWLRGEWTAWARQRYRRVARLLDLSRTPLAGGPAPPSSK